MRITNARELKSKLRKKIEEGLRDIRNGKTVTLSAYRAARFSKKTGTAFP